MVFEEGDSVIRIGMIGAQSHHAQVFAALCNQSGKYPDMRITHIWGESKEFAFERKEKQKIETMVDSPEEMVGQVDAVMIVLRDGRLHYRAAEPFLKRGMPIWMDKPFCITEEDAQKLLKLKEKGGSLVTGGSICKYVEDIQTLKELWRTGRFQSGILSFDVQLNSVYSGIHFYAPHLVEMAQEVFGFQMRSVHAFEKNGGIIAIVHYDDYDVILNFTANSHESEGILWGENKVVRRTIDISAGYELAFDEFAKMVREKKQPFDLQRLAQSVKIVGAIDQARRCGKEVRIEAVL